MRHFTEEDVQMADKHSVNIITIREVQTETSRRCHHTPISRTEIQKVIISNAGEDAEKNETLLYSNTNVK